MNPTTEKVENFVPQQDTSQMAKANEDLEVNRSLFQRQEEYADQASEPIITQDDSHDPEKQGGLWS
ncbi:hypothetical protein AAVH_11425 [Aphelenchoides avenae]|nr:hypothetical protein AAVH_11425 [Aphelenchus avenae]